MNNLEKSIKLMIKTLNLGTDVKCCFSDALITSLAKYQPTSIEEYRKKIPEELRISIEKNHTDFLEVIFRLIQLEVKFSNERKLKNNSIIEEDYPNTPFILNFEFKNSFKVIDSFNNTVKFTKEEMKKIEIGFKARNMDDKWHIYSSENKLYFRRSWTGHYIYKCYFVELEDNFLLDRLEINRDEKQYREKDDEYDIELCLYLIDILLLEKDSEKPKRKKKKNENTK